MKKGLKRNLVICIGIVTIAVMLGATACTSETSDYEKQGIKFYKLKDISGFEFLNHYTGSMDAYLCKLENNDATELAIPSEFKGKPVIAVSTDSVNDTLINLEIPYGILYISGGFSNYSALTNIHFPVSLKGIFMSFRNCDSLLSVDIPGDIEIIDGFGQCDALHDVTIQGDCLGISAGSFDLCSSLSEVVYNGAIGTISDDSFTGCDALLSAEKDGLTDDEWARVLWDDAYKKMVETEDIQTDLLTDKIILPFNNDGEPEFVSKAVREKYSGSDFAISGKVIWGDYLLSSDIHIREHTDAPFANNRAECDYLLICAGLVSRVDKNYYNNNVDRNMVTTLVFIIDVSQRKFAHIEYIGKDCPGVVTKNRNGKVLSDQAEEYMRAVSGED